MFHMIYRLIDKIIIAVLSASALFFLVGGASSGVRGFLVRNEFAVACVLFIVIILLATEVFRSVYVSTSLLIIVAGLTFVIPDVVVVLPSCVYGLFSDLKMEKLLDHFHAMRNAGRKDADLFEERALWLKILLLVVVAVISAPSLTIIPVIVAMLLATKTMYMHRRETVLTDMFDEVRNDAQQSVRLKNEISNNLDMQIRNATLAERNRIARDIHDNVGHMLTRAVVQLQAINVINQDEKTKPYLESVTNTVNEAMTNIRRSVHELHDDSIDLSIGIHEIASALKDRFDVTVSTSIESPVPTDVKNAILGIFKEGVTNIAKHSNGKKVRLEVVENVTFWRILVSDDGTCEPMELSRSSDFAALEGEHGIGLYNIHSRAVSCGGRASIRGGEDGFHITVTIPRKEAVLLKEDKK